MPRRVRPLVLLVLAVALVLAGCGEDASEDRQARDGGPAGQPGAGKPPVRLGTKNFTEQYLLGELYAQALRAKGFTVDLKPDIGATEVTDRALTSGVIDLYPEYTGTSLSVVKGQDRVPGSAEATYERAKAFYESRGQTLLAMTPFEDRDAVVVTRAFAAQHGLESTGDLRALGSQVTLGAPPEFRTRRAGLVGLRQAYGLTELRFEPLAIDEILGALDDGRIQAGDVFTTDPRLADRMYVVLADPKGIFGYQNVAPVVAEETLDEQGPAFAETLDAVSATLTTDVMRRLNASVDIDGEAPDVVARRFLRQRGLLD